jgi:glucose/arabinose dehydrogenase
MRHLFGAAALMLTAVHACGCGSSHSGSLFAADGSGDGSSGDGGQAFGLDLRPPNPTCVAPPRPVTDTGVKLQRVWTGLTFSQPIYLTQAPGDNDRWFVVGRQGTVRSFPTAASVPADLKDFVAVTVNTSGEGGLLGLAFHPNWQSNHEAYLSYTRSSVAGDPPSPASCGTGGANVFTSVIARFKSADSGLTLSATPDEILKLGQPFTNHDGGNIQFSPIDQMLYIGFGDGGSGNDPCGSGQDLTSRLGKILRIDVNAAAGSYKIPADNPFASSTTFAKEIWSYGHRNPWRWSFDALAGDLWVGDVGQDEWEEIDHVVKGGNYGWNLCEGFHKRGGKTALCDTPGLLDPVVEHGRTEAQSITGGYVYRGAAMPSLVGTYIYGDYATGNIWALTYDASNKPVPKIVATVAANTLVSFGQGNDGEIYTVQISGVISKLVPNGVVVPDTFPKLLSQTGCVDAKDATKPAAGMIPYDVNSPLWSDGAKKERFFAIPDGTTITVGADNDWDLPIGSVAMKTFSVEGRLIETRLFMRHSDGGWAGYTYEWNDQETDAALLPAGKVKAVGALGQLWTYPSRTQCIQCHSAGAGGTIGLETWQLNRDFVYASTTRTSSRRSITSAFSPRRSPVRHRVCRSYPIRRGRMRSSRARGATCTPTARTATARMAAARGRWTCASVSHSKTR